MPKKKIGGISPFPTGGSNRLPKKKRPTIPKTGGTTKGPGAPRKPRPNKGGGGIPRF